VTSSMRKTFKYKVGDILERNIIDKKDGVHLKELFVVLLCCYRVRHLSKRGGRQKRIREYVLYHIEQEERHTFTARAVDNPRLVFATRSGKVTYLNYWSKMSRD